ncbi:MAG: PIG-L family deacetylase [Candidatus Obscuribacterales bacterium]|nr:PIG-L family deacetylase [Candidatus Obscuribacterales bacterium]
MKIESPKAIVHELESFQQLGSVLFIAAHPDDENTELLAYLSRGRKYRTAYLSITRGDGGQNLLSADLGEKLGVARTQELLAARQIDGAQQLFTRAIDFGFSKSYEETLKIWNKDEVLSDVVRAIRVFRPDVVIARFSPKPGGTHGHHTASTILALEAFKMAGDPKAFPAQKLAPWQPKRLVWNVSPWQKDKISASDRTIEMDAGGNDFVSGQSYHSLANESRAMHKTQGFDQYKIPGGHGEPRIETFQLLDGEPASSDIMDGITTTWSRLSGGAEIDKEIKRIIAAFDLQKPSSSVPGLLDLRSKLIPLAAHDPIVREKLSSLDHIIQACLGLKVETTIEASAVVPGEPMHLKTTANLSKHPGQIPVKWLSVSFPDLKKEVTRNVFLKEGEQSSVSTVEKLPPATSMTQPYWLRKEGTPGLFHVDDPHLIGTPDDQPYFPVDNTFEIGGQKITITGEPFQVTSDGDGTQIKRRLDVIPPVSLRFLSDVLVLKPGGTRSVDVEIESFRNQSAGAVKLESPAGWRIEPAEQTFDLSKVGQRAKFTFCVTAPTKGDSATITACVDMHGSTYRNQRQEIRYAHLPPQLLQPPAVVKAVSLDLAIRGHQVGYIPGAGDSLVDNLQQMGYRVKVLDDANPTSKDLEGLDAVVLGVRALNVRKALGTAMPLLLSYVENGGTLISQYNRPDKLMTEKFSPFDLQISADRVTDEKAVITLLSPDAPILNAPNKISSHDFDNWVQERGLYFPNKWDEHFTPIVACNDPGEPPTKGALLIAKYGKGYYVYTGLSFFRQLPAGVPGAYRLFANMVSVGK